MVRFPDLFRTYVFFFGISDYAGWHTSKGRPDCNTILERVLGGPRDKLPDVYLARNAIPAAGNARGGRLHFIWDEAETDCPPTLIEAFLAAHKEAGLDNAVAHVSKRTDVVRWKHAYRSSNRDLTKADDLYLPDVLVKDAKSPTLPPTGRLVVPGYLVTRHFQVWVEDGTKGQVAVEYDVRGAEPSVKVVENVKGYRVRVEKRSPLGKLPSRKLCSGSRQTSGERSPEVWRLPLPQSAGRSPES